MQSFANKTVVLTGASDGIGAEIARQLAPEKPRLVLAARNEDRLTEVAFRCRKAGAEILVRGDRRPRRKGAATYLSADLG